MKVGGGEGRLGRRRQLSHISDLIGTDKVLLEDSVPQRCLLWKVRARFIMTEKQPRDRKWGQRRERGGTVCTPPGATLDASYGDGCGHI